MTTTIRSSADGTQSIIAVGGVDKVTIGANGIATGSYAPQSITPTELSQKLTSGVAVPTTSGTAIDFTGIPSWVKRITVMFSGVRLSGTSLPQIQIGSGTVKTTGYLSGATNLVSSVGSATSTTGLLLDGGAAAANLRHGVAVLCLMNAVTNLWVLSSVLGMSDIAGVKIGGGSVSIPGVLDRVRLTSVNGTDTFDAGSINIMWE